MTFPRKEICKCSFTCGTNGMICFSCKTCVSTGMGSIAGSVWFSYLYFRHIPLPVPRICCCCQCDSVLKAAAKGCCSTNCGTYSAPLQCALFHRFRSHTETGELWFAKLCLHTRWAIPLAHHRLSYHATFEQFLHVRWWLPAESQLPQASARPSVFCFGTRAKTGSQTHLPASQFACASRTLSYPSYDASMNLPSMRKVEYLIFLSMSKSIFLPKACPVLFLPNLKYRCCLRCVQAGRALMRSC